MYYGPKELAIGLKAVLLPNTDKTVSSSPPLCFLPTPVFKIIKISFRNFSENKKVKFLIIYIVNDTV